MTKQQKAENSAFAEIMLAEDSDISEVQLLRTGKFDYYGEIMEITPEMLQTMKKNFDDKVVKTDLAIDYFHFSHAEAAGWIKEVILKEEDSELWVRVEWTEKAKEKILSKEIRYLSVDFETNYTDNETRKTYGATLRGGGLTNRPFVKGMNPILSEFIHRFDKADKYVNNREDETAKNLNEKEKEKTKMNLQEIKQEVVTLSEADRKELASVLGVSTGKEVQLSEEVKTLKSQLEAKDKEIKFSELLTAGKVVPAQKEAFISGDMAKFAELAVKVNLDEPQGKGDVKLDDDVKSGAEANAKFAKLAEERAKKDNISFAEASNRVAEEQPELAKKAFEL